jgi:hypothetical protein
MSIIPFDKIVPGAAVRFTMIDDMQYLSATDTIKLFGGKKSKGTSETFHDIAAMKSASQTWKRMLKAEAYSEITEACRQYQFKEVL